MLFKGSKIFIRVVGEDGEELVIRGFDTVFWDKPGVFKRDESGRFSCINGTGLKSCKAIL